MINFVLKNRYLKYRSTKIATYDKLGGDLSMIGLSRSGKCDGDRTGFRL